MNWTINAAALEFDSDRRTLTKALKKLGVETGKGIRHSTRDICRALYGDLDRERAIGQELDNEKQRILNAQLKGEMVPMSEAAALYTAALLPVRQRLLSMPPECATRANPTDPQFALAALQEWVDATLPLIRAELSKSKGAEAK